MTSISQISYLENKKIVSAHCRRPGGCFQTIYIMSNVIPPPLVSSDAAEQSSAAEALREGVEFLKQKLHELQSTASQNGTLPLPSLSSSLTTMAPPEKSGYLFKWQDRSIGWGGTKW